MHTQMSKFRLSLVVWLTFTMLGQGLARDQEDIKTLCPFVPGWKPTAEQLANTLRDHKEWASRYRQMFDQRWAALERGEIQAAAQIFANFDRLQGRANFCNANLQNAKLNGIDLTGANLNHAILLGADLSDANLTHADLNGANLHWAILNRSRLFQAELNNVSLEAAEIRMAELSLAKLNSANLQGADLSESILVDAELNQAVLSGATLSEAKLIRAHLNKADLTIAKLNEADLFDAEMNNAILSGANLSKTNLYRTKMHKADLTMATLREANLSGTFLSEARLLGVDLTDAMYAPVSPPPDISVADIKGLETVKFGPGDETGLAQLRDLLQKAGLRDLERRATFAIENGKTKNALANWREDRSASLEGTVREVAFNWTVAYGLHPARALFLIVALATALVPVYWWAISRRQTSTSGLFRTWPKDRLEIEGDQPKLEMTPRVMVLHTRGPAALGWASYFSLMSAFQLGYGEFSIGAWLARAQPRVFTLEPLGWVRVVSGVQSLLSLYLFAIWALTLAGRPFQ
jgi:uncharacterized protein YjbI with pentapeptide repeats